MLKKYPGAPQLFDKSRELRGKEVVRVMRADKAVSAQAQLKVLGRPVDDGMVIAFEFLQVRRIAGNDIKSCDFGVLSAYPAIESEPIVLCPVGLFADDPYVLVRLCEHSFVPFTVPRTDSPTL